MARLILTRPQEQADSWLHSFKEAGYDIVSWPLISIQSIQDTTLVAQLWKEWTSYQAVMFVSRSAVDHAMMHKPQFHMWGQTRCWATGPGTKKALVSHGVPIQLIDAPDDKDQQFDTESLWKIVHTKIDLKQPVLIVRGADVEDNGFQLQGVGREWLSQQIKAQGIRVDTVASYIRSVPLWNSDQQMQADLATQDGSIWILSSSQALDHLTKLLPNQSWNLAKALVTHERIAQSAKQLRFGVVRTSRPLMADMLASLEYF